ncbi:hypothetical protein KW789_02825 [Candidatus Saccharibacteria bacterium]|nr:hypothetical protein [Candidatus Saccharibacteria bacterium]
MPTRHKTRRGSPLHLTPSFDLFSKSKQLVMDNLWVFGPLYILPALFLINNWLTNPNGLSGISRWRYDLENRSGGWSTPTFPNYTISLFFALGIMAIIWIVLSVIIQIMTMDAQLRAAQGKRLDFTLLWDTVKELGWRMVGLYLLVGLYIVVGLILLIVPGLIMIRRYMLAPYVMLDQKTGIREAMEKSAAMSKPYSGYVWGVLGVMFLIALLNIIPLIGGLLAFVGGILYSVAPAIRYQELKKIVK